MKHQKISRDEGCQHFSGKPGMLYGPQNYIDLTETSNGDGFYEISSSIVTVKGLSIIIT